MLTGHITESLLTIVGSHVWAKLSDADKKVFEEVLTQAAAKATDQIRASEQKLADELRSSARPWSRSTARPSARRRCRCTTTRSWRRLDPGRIRRAAGAEVALQSWRGDAAPARRVATVCATLRRWHRGTCPARGDREDDARTIASPSAADRDDVHLIVAEDEEVVIEHHPEDWIAFVLFWALAFIVFLQFFTRYVLNDSLAWTEEIARYGLMWLAFIGGAMVTRRNTHIAVELLSNLMKPGRLRAALLALVDFVKLGFLGAARLFLGH